jgi:hypothetical protein
MREHWRIGMRATVAALALLSALSLRPAVAQKAGNPEECLERLQSCRSECRARIFAVDPRRDVCLRGCAETGLKCTQAVESGAKLAPSAQSNRSR